MTLHFDSSLILVAGPWTTVFSVDTVSFSDGSGNKSKGLGNCIQYATKMYKNLDSKRGKSVLDSLVNVFNPKFWALWIEVEISCFLRINYIFISFPIGTTKPSPVSHYQTSKLYNIQIPRYEFSSYWVNQRKPSAKLEYLPSAPRPACVGIILSLTKESRLKSKLVKEGRPRSFQDSFSSQRTFHSYKIFPGSKCSTFKTFFWSCDFKRCAILLHE